MSVESSEGDDGDGDGGDSGGGLAPRRTSGGGGGGGGPGSGRSENDWISDKKSATSHGFSQRSFVVKLVRWEGHSNRWLVVASEALHSRHIAESVAPMRTWKSLRRLQWPERN